MEDHSGKTLAAVVEKAGTWKPKLGILFVVDGCRADALYGALDGGNMPHLKKFMDDLGYCRYEKCWTVFPSVTIACHASIVTGAYPGLHGIVGNNWFIRKKWSGDIPKCKFYEATREYVKFSWIHPKTDPGLGNGILTGKSFTIANADMYVEARTAYEAYNTSTPDGRRPRSMSVLEMVTRGADERELLDVDDAAIVGGYLFTFWSRIKSLFSGEPMTYFNNTPLDRRAFTNLIDALEKGESTTPGVLVVWLPGMDGFSHSNGAARQPEYFRPRRWPGRLLLGTMDGQFKRLHKALAKKDLLDKVLIAVTADHGQYQSAEGRLVSAEDIYRYLRDDPEAGAGESFPLDAEGEVDEECTDASVAVSPNGGACHVYVRSANGWGELPSPDRLRKFLAPLANHPSTDKVFVRSGKNKYDLWEDGQIKPLDNLDDKNYPLAEERVNGLTQTMRSGDVVLSAKIPDYYASSGYKGEHGSLRREDSQVPLMFIGKGLKHDAAEGDAATNDRDIVAKDARTIDVAPTIARLMGFDAELRQPGTDREKLDNILDALEILLNSSFHRRGGGWFIARLRNRLREARVRREWAKEVRDMRQNFEFKLDKYLKDNRISEEDHRKLDERYAKL